jgi:hypothetical protein
MEGQAFRVTIKELRNAIQPHRGLDPDFKGDVASADCGKDRYLQS